MRRRTGAGLRRIVLVPAAEHGIALLSVIVAVFILTLVVAVMAALTIGEVTLAHDHLRGQQALAAAEAGAYRALAELRRRVSVDLGARVGQSGVSADDVRSICLGAGPPPREPVELIATYAYPLTLGVSDWERSGGTAWLWIGRPSAPVQMLDLDSGSALAEFHATVAVRWSGRAPTCRFGPGETWEVILWFDHAILAGGRSGTATRAVCLRSPSSDRCARWFPAPAAGWQGSHTLSGGAFAGWPVLIERTGDGLTAPRPPHPAAVFQQGDPLYQHPDWEELLRW